MKIIIEIPDSVAATVRTDHDRAVMANFFRNLLKEQSKHFTKDSHQERSLIALSETNIRVIT